MNPKLHFKELEMSFLGEEGLDAVGITHEMFKIFWHVSWQSIALAISRRHQKLITGRQSANAWIITCFKLSDLIILEF